MLKSTNVENNIKKLKQKCIFLRREKIQYQWIKNQILLSGKIRKRIGYLHAIKPCILPLLKYLHRVLGINRPVKKIKKITKQKHSA